MRKYLGVILSIAGVIVFVVCFLWSLYLDFKIIGADVGTWGVVIGVLILPITLVIAPLYVAVVHGFWFPVILAYGGGTSGAALYTIGRVILPD